ncbi:G2/M phase-specific E3 ubiquitin-protein ligase-like [Halichoeres trimaculatus]|uniref:G2/M phase-specific E3 ubiquitin-protein ligase-like n=1 Tax=Halichoeres trimaculatus TaxID=147232 RepID=UPI003D9F3771
MDIGYTKKEDDGEDESQLSSNSIHSSSKMATKASVSIDNDDQDCFCTTSNSEEKNDWNPDISGPDGGSLAGSDGIPDTSGPDHGRGTSSTRGISGPDGKCSAGSDCIPGTSGPDGGPGTTPTRGISGADGVCLARHNGRSCLDEDNYSSYLTLVATISDDSSEDDAGNNSQYGESHGDIISRNSGCYALFKEILLELASKINVNPRCRFNINRSAIWEGAIRGFKRLSYEPHLMMSVKFSDDMGKHEEGVDLGGPRREFLRHLMENIAQSPMFEGKENSQNFALNGTALREDWYYMAGRAIAISLVHGGPPPNFLSPVVFSLLVDVPANPVLDDIADTDLLEKVTKVSESTTIEDLEKAKAPLHDYLANAGCLRPLRSVRDRDLLVQDIGCVSKLQIMFQVIHRVQGPFQRFHEGLKTLGVLEKIQKHPDSFRPLFCYEPTTLTADQLDDLFTIRLSPEGSNKRVVEEVVIPFWRDYLQDAEGKEGPSKLQKILAFATGASVVLPICFSPSPSVEFIYKGDDDFSSTPLFPMANTCVNCIRLPLHVSYQLFKEKFDFALGNTYGFGRA